MNKQNPALESFTVNFMHPNTGMIEVIDSMGNDRSIVDSARVSYNYATPNSDERDRKLINYLMKHDHGTPFEMASMKMRIECPIFVARQWMRHRMGSFNEISGRYTEMTEQFYRPTAWRKQALKNRQASSDETIEDPGLDEDVKIAYNAAYTAYKSLLERGVSREQARMVLPLATKTKFIWCVNARSLMNFLTLRNAPDAQHEIREFAKAIETQIMSRWLPLTYGAFKKKKEGEL